MEKEIMLPFDGSLHPILERANNIYKALKSGDYKIDYREPNNILSCTAPDGRTFYKIVDMDGVKSSNDFGGCAVHVTGETFESPWGYDAELTSGFYNDLEKASDELAELDIDAEKVSETITDALCDVPGALWGEYTEFDDQIEAAIACGYDADAEFYWCEDPECPIEQDNMMLIEDHNKGQVEFEGMTFYLYEDPDWKTGTVHAIAKGTVPDDDGSYVTVLLYVQKDLDNELLATSVEVSDDIYVAW